MQRPEIVTGNKSKPESKTREQILTKKKELERKRYEKIKSNPELYAKHKEKNKEKYQKRKEDGKVACIYKLSAQDQSMLRQKWREEARKSYQRKKEARIQRFTEGDNPSSIDNINIDKIDHGCGNEPESSGNDCRPTRSNLKSRDASPASSQVSSVSSAGTSYPTSQRLIKKLRDKKDKEIASLRSRLQSVNKVNDDYRKKLSLIKIQSYATQRNDIDSTLPDTSYEDATTEVLLRSYKSN